jgi:hypothetical protein
MTLSLSLKNPLSRSKHLGKERRARHTHTHTHTHTHIDIAHTACTGKCCRTRLTFTIFQTPVTSNARYTSAAPPELADDSRNSYHLPHDEFGCGRIRVHAAIAAGAFVCMYAYVSTHTNIYGHGQVHAHI